MGTLQPDDRGARDYADTPAAEASTAVKSQDRAQTRATTTINASETPRSRSGQSAPAAATGILGAINGFIAQNPIAAGAIAFCALQAGRIFAEIVLGSTSSLSLRAAIPEFGLAFAALALVSRHAAREGERGAQK